MQQDLIKIPANTDEELIKPFTLQEIHDVVFRMEKT